MPLTFQVFEEVLQARAPEANATPEKQLIMENHQLSQKQFLAQERLLLG